ncbi:MAG: NAD-dependent epimerase/dehydratase family protein [Bacteroidia bacterium]|nr:NAD-dependent epimerase/dehydratase family protein [Bacteroidia bacterium]
MSKEKVLIIGSCGQVGTELSESLRNIYGNFNVISSDLKKPQSDFWNQAPFETLNVLDKKNISEIFSKHKPSIVFHLAALLSATAEKNPKQGWELNMNGLFNIFDASIDFGVKRIFWPSSIAVFGPTTPKINTPQKCIIEPNTVYGITKLTGERYCEYYFNRYGLDVRSLRYPGLIGYKSDPGGGTTDYAVEIFHEALKNKRYTCFLKPDTNLPMLYMPDAVKATLDITHAASEKIKIRSSYNLSGFSFSPSILAQKIKNHIPDFEISYNPDQRQAIAESWPGSIDDFDARQDWGWQNDYDLDGMVKDMIENLTARYSSM